MVGFAAERPLSDPRNAHHRLLHDARRHAVDRGVVPLPVAHAVAPEAREPALTPLCAHADRREPLARAARYGFDKGLVDFGRGAIVPYTELLEEILVLIEQDARHFGCIGEVSYAREILARGTSADRQVAAFEQALSAGASRAEALAAVVDWLIAETVRGV